MSCSHHTLFVCLGVLCDFDHSIFYVRHSLVHHALRSFDVRSHVAQNCNHAKKV